MARYFIEVTTAQKFVEGFTRFRVPKPEIYCNEGRSFLACVIELAGYSIDLQLDDTQSWLISEGLLNGFETASEAHEIAKQLKGSHEKSAINIVLDNSVLS